jgi:uncharacterized membrane protein
MMEMEFIVFYLLFLLYPCLLFILYIIRLERYTTKQKDIFKCIVIIPAGVISAFGFSIIIAEAINIDNPMDSWIFRFLWILNTATFFITIQRFIDSR